MTIVVVKSKCRDCGRRTDRIVSVRSSIPGEIRHEWLCASCEYLRLNPDAKRVPSSRPLPLQAETIFPLSPSTFMRGDAVEPSA